MTACPLLPVGAGGLARETLAACRATNAAHNAPVWNVLGMLDDNPERHGDIVDGSILPAFTAPQRISGHVVFMPHCTVTHDDRSPTTSRSPHGLPSRVA